MKNPSIRFKSTSNVTFPDWEAFPLANFATLHNGRAYKQEELLETGKYPVLRVGNFFTNSKWYFSDLDLDQSKIAEDGDLLYAWSASFGPKIWTGQKVIYHYHIWKITTTDRIDKGFLYFLLQKDALALGKELNGGTMSHLTKASMEARCFRIPSGEEQQKIASFFSTLDQKIELNERKLEALEKLKKGVMQKCFNNSNWTKHQLKDVCKSFSGGTPNSKNRSFYNGEIPFIRSGEIHQNITELSVTTEAVKNSSAKLVKSGDLLYALYGANSGDCDLSKINGAINQAILCIRPKSDNIVDMLFLKEQLFHLKSKITSKYLQGGQGNLSGRLVMNLSILLPPYIEQLTYSSLFGSINNKIEITKQKLFLLQKLKQGLMQQMFI